MNILFYSQWSNTNIWYKKIKKTFKDAKIYTLEDNPDLNKIEIAIIWRLPDEVYKKLNNLKLVFSLGAGVDHIINLPSYNKLPIIRLKDPLMAERMSNHVLSQILYFQLHLNAFRLSQEKKHWRSYELGDEIRDPELNSEITIGILGCGYLGTFVGNTLGKLGYNVQGFKNSKTNKKYNFKVFYEKKELKNFIKSSNIIVSILPSTKETSQIININFLRLMKKESLLINVGRGASINEDDLISHLKTNKYFYASLDVFQTEPLPKKHKFWNIKNLTITPHVASNTVISSAIDEIYRRYLEFRKNKKIKSDVNLKKGY